MRPQRNKQFDWSKPFKLVDNKKEFDQIETGEDLVISIQNKQSQAQTAAYKKQNIITPRIQEHDRVTSIKPFAKINPNYIRLTQKLNLPKLVDYELTQVENVFVKTHAQKYKFKGRAILTSEFLSKVFIELETKAGKDPVIPRNKGWMILYLQREHKQLLEWQNLENFASLIYNFWKNRRQQLKFPLLRPLWRPNPEQFNHLLAFKPRQKEKRNLRKTTRISEDDILAELHDEFNIAKQITERVQIRQELRLKHLQAQLSIFHNQCKFLFGTPSFFGQVSQQARVKDKEKIKSLHQKLDRVKFKRQQPNEPQIQPILHQIYDQRLSVANFLATVIAQAQVFGIGYSSVFQSKPQLSFIPEPVVPAPIQEPIVQQPLLNMNLSKAGDYLIREFQSMQYQSSDQSINLNEKNRCSFKRHFADVFDFKKTKVSEYYFGQDDEGDFKDLRKNISANFKKFQSQLKQV